MVIMQYFEASNGSFLVEINKKVAQVNENIDYQIRELEKRQQKALMRTKETLDSTLRNYADDKVQKSITEARRYGDDRRVAAMHQLRKEFNDKIRDEVQEKL